MTMKTLHAILTIVAGGSAITCVSGIHYELPALYIGAGIVGVASALGAIKLQGKLVDY